jgi:hypothetical protein
LWTPRIEVGVVGYYCKGQLDASFVRRWTNFSALWRRDRQRRLPSLQAGRQPDLRLAMLAPDIVEAILEGRADQSLMLERLERPLPASWDEQRQRVLSTRTS